MFLLFVLINSSLIAFMYVLYACIYMCMPMYIYILFIIYLYINCSPTFGSPCIYAFVCYLFWAVYFDVYNIYIYMHTYIHTHTSMFNALGTKL